MQNRVTKAGNQRGEVDLGRKGLEECVRGKLAADPVQRRKRLHRRRARDRSHGCEQREEEAKLWCLITREHSALG